MRVIAGRGFGRQKDGSHLLCANVACRVPLERPYTFLKLMGELPGEGLAEFSVAVCERCRAAVGGLGQKVEMDHETSYGG